MRINVLVCFEIWGGCTAFLKQVSYVHQGCIHSTNGFKLWWMLHIGGG